MKNYKTLSCAVLDGPLNHVFTHTDIQLSWIFMIIFSVEAVSREAGQIARGSQQVSNF